MEKTIWIINQYASHLTSRHEGLAKTFADKGYKVAIITSSFHHGRKEYIFNQAVVRKEIYKGVTYFYLHSSPTYQSNGVGRILNMLDFCLMVGKNKKIVVDHTGKPEYIIASSAPPFVWEIGYRMARHYNAKFIAEFRDIWPMSLIDVQGVSPKHPLVKLFSLIEKRAYLHSDSIVSTMPYAWKHVTRVAAVPKEKINWMPNGINVAEVETFLKSSIQLPADLQNFLNSHWCGVYLGSIVKSECLDFILRGFSKVNDSDIFLAIIGEGQEKERIQKLASELNIKNIRFFPAIEKKMVPKVLQMAKFCVAALRDIPICQYGLSMNKLNDYLLSGIPTILACNAENVVKEAGHFSISCGDEQLLAKTIVKIKELDEDELDALKKSGQAIIKKQYDYRLVAESYLRVLESL